MPFRYDCESIHEREKPGHSPAQGISCYLQRSPSETNAGRLSRDRARSVGAVRGRLPRIVGGVHGRACAASRRKAQLARMTYLLDTDTLIYAVRGLKISSPKTERQKEHLRKANRIVVRCRRSQQ